MSEIRDNQPTDLGKEISEALKAEQEQVNKNLRRQVILNLCLNL